MQLFEGPISAILCLGLLVPSAPVVGQTPGAPTGPLADRKGARPDYHSGQLRGDERILHALDRFTFGARPGDVDAVRAMGLEKWFEQQLHPASLDESTLDAHLAQYPAMQWSTQDLLYYLPSNAVIRQAMNGRLPVPERGVLHTVYANQMDRIAARQQARAEKTNDSQAAPPSPNSSAPMNAGMAGDVDGEKSENPSPMTKEPAAAPSESPAMDMGANLADPAHPVFDESAFNSIVKLPAGERIVRLAAMQQPDFDAFIKSLRQMQRAQLVGGLTAVQKQTVAALENPERLVVEELIAERLTRDIYSNAQLQEVMTDFWLNHFNIYLRKNEVMPYDLVSYERDTIRPHALGKFEDLLEATAHSPAMLVYLDNASSIGPDSIAAVRAKDNAWRRPAKLRKVPEGLNENYGRELMELHTLGVNDGYTQADVIQVARILTGWTVDKPLRGGNFVFNPNRHESGTKKVMGQKFKDQGELQGRQLLHFLATRPATAHFISRELAERFVSDNPPQSVVDRMARAYMSSGGDISAVLTALFHAPEFWSASVYRAKVKTPLEYVVSAVRASNANIENLRPLANALRQMGMPIYGCVPPTGYSWQSSAWVSTGALVDRMNFALSLAANRLPGIKVAWMSQAGEGDVSLVADTAARTPEAEESRLESLLVPGGVSVATRSAVLQQFEQQSAQNPERASGMAVAAEMRPPARARAAGPLERQDQLLAGLLLGSPEFQRR
jgi:uncharacterized protein (DUF1800 family)